MIFWQTLKGTFSHYIHIFYDFSSHLLYYIAYNSILMSMLIDFAICYYLLYTHTISRINLQTRAVSLTLI